MSWVTHRRFRWLVLGCAVLVVASAIMAWLGVRARADAEQDLEASRADLAATITAASDAAASLASAVEDRDAAAASLANAKRGLTVQEERLAVAEAALPVAEQAMWTFLDAAAAAVEQAAAPAAFHPQMVQIRRDQVTAAGEGEYGEFNELQLSFNSVCADANAELQEFSDLVVALPARDPKANGVPGYEAIDPYTEADLLLDVPTGPAEVTATAPDVVPCIVSGNSGCEYVFQVTFTESNTLAATIERIAVRWIERSGNTWWFDADGEWKDEDLVIPASGTMTYTDSIWTDADDEMRRIMGGTVRLRYNGTDAEGNAFNGSISATLERPD